MWGMDGRGKGRKKEATWETNVSILMRDNDGTIYCNGHDQGRRKFRILGVHRNQDRLRFR